MILLYFIFLWFLILTLELFCQDFLLLFLVFNFLFFHFHILTKFNLFLFLTNSLSFIFKLISPKQYFCVRFFFKRCFFQGSKYFFIRSIWFCLNLSTIYFYWLFDYLSLKFHKYLNLLFFYTVFILSSALSSCFITITKIYWQIIYI